MTQPGLPAAPAVASTQTAIPRPAYSGTDVTSTPSLGLDYARSLARVAGMAAAKANAQVPQRTLYPMSMEDMQAPMQAASWHACQVWSDNFDYLEEQAGAIMMLPSAQRLQLYQQNEPWFTDAIPYQIPITEADSEGKLSNGVMVLPGTPGPYVQRCLAANPVKWRPYLQDYQRLKAQNAA